MNESEVYDEANKPTVDYALVSEIPRDTTI